MQLEEFWGRPIETPLRVYVGLASRETPEEAAELALKELIRAGGFERSLLVIATPTGTGWLDPGAVDTLEYLHAGDTAIVSDAVFVSAELDHDPCRSAAFASLGPHAVRRCVFPLDVRCRRRVGPSFICTA